MSQRDNLHLPLLTFCCCQTNMLHRSMTESQPWTTPSVTVGKSSSVHARDSKFKHFKTSVAHTRNWTFHHCVTSSHTSVKLYLKDRAISPNAYNHGLCHLSCERGIGQSVCEVQPLCRCFSIKQRSCCKSQHMT